MRGCRCQWQMTVGWMCYTHSIVHASRHHVILCTQHIKRASKPGSVSGAGWHTIII
jgi:hypothetical protein